MSDLDLFFWGLLGFQLYTLIILFFQSRFEIKLRNKIDSLTKYVQANRKISISTDFDIYKLTTRLIQLEKLTQASIFVTEPETCAATISKLIDVSMKEATQEELDAAAESIKNTYGEDSAELSFVLKYKEDAKKQPKKKTTKKKTNKKKVVKKKKTIKK